MYHYQIISVVKEDNGNFQVSTASFDDPQSTPVATSVDPGLLNKCLVYFKLLEPYRLVGLEFYTKEPRGLIELLVRVHWEVVGQ